MSKHSWITGVLSVISLVSSESIAQLEPRPLPLPGQYPPQTTGLLLPPSGAASSSPAPGVTAATMSASVPASTGLPLPPQQNGELSGDLGIILFGVNDELHLQGLSTQGAVPSGRLIVLDSNTPTPFMLSYPMPANRTRNARPGQGEPTPEPRAATLVQQHREPSSGLPCR